MKCNWIGQTFRKKCLLKHAIERKIEGRIEVTGGRGIILKQLLNVLKEKRGYWKFKEETLACTVCRTSFGRDYGPRLRQTKGNIDKCSLIENKLRKIKERYGTRRPNMSSLWNIVFRAHVSYTSTEKRG
jgi:hypothetical protein